MLNIPLTILISETDSVAVDLYRRNLSLHIEVNLPIQPLATPPHIIGKTEIIE
jgi:hypothetical protein